MREIVIISGKGGTGKTSVAAALALTAKNGILVADCDVEASNLPLILSPTSSKKETFYSGFLPEIDQASCTLCGICEDVCNYRAISLADRAVKINELSCEGCGYCAHVCPENAISIKTPAVGTFMVSQTRSGQTMFHAQLNPGADNSGKLVFKTKNEARNFSKSNRADILLIDGPPGIGCPVISALSGADYALVVTESTVSGFHDLQRIFSIADKFSIPCGIVINKSDLNPDSTRSIRDFCRKKELQIIGEIPYDQVVTESMSRGKAMVEISSSYQKLFRDFWEKIMDYST